MLNVADHIQNNFLLSSSMDKTVRLWHISRGECLCCFKHNDFVTSIQFHPRDDRFFLAGSLDSKLRLWSIPDKGVAYWNALPELITAVAFSPDGKTAIAGCLNGVCLFFETEGLKFQSQIHVRSAHGKNAKGSKITGIQAVSVPPDDTNGEVKLLITSNDSRIRVYSLRDKSLDLKLKGNDNSCSQIRASFSDDAKYIICGSEDCKAYIWPTRQTEVDKDKRPVEMFEAHPAVVTTAIMAPTKTRRLLSASTDPLYDLCNPPPVTLVSRAHSEQSSIPQVDEEGHAGNEVNKPSSKPEESPAYLARCAHSDGNIVVTADLNGQIKVFRQDCAYQNRLRINDSSLSKKMLGRTNSVATRHSNRSHRESFQTNNHSSDRILSWRQSINSTTGSLDGVRNGGHGSTAGPLSHKRSVSPRKSLGQLSMQSGVAGGPHRGSQSARLPQTSSFTAASESSPLPSPGPGSAPIDPNHVAAQSPHEPGLLTQDKTANPLMLQGDQSYMFWNRNVFQAQAAHAQLDIHAGGDSRDSLAGTSTPGDSTRASLDDAGHGGHGSGRLGVPLAREVTAVSRLSSEEGSVEGDGGRRNGSIAMTGGGGNGTVSCRKCGGDKFRMKNDLAAGENRRGGGGRIMECADCGLIV